jgi:hypothetical protein
VKGLQGGGAFSHFIKSGRSPSSGCSSKSTGLAVAPFRSAPHRTALRRLAPTRRENTTTVHNAPHQLAHVNSAEEGIADEAEEEH